MSAGKDVFLRNNVVENPYIDCWNYPANLMRVYLISRRNAFDVLERI